MKRWFEIAVLGVGIALASCLLFRDVRSQRIDEQLAPCLRGHTATCKVDGLTVSVHYPDAKP